MARHLHFFVGMLFVGAVLAACRPAPPPETARPTEARPATATAERPPDPSAYQYVLSITYAMQDDDETVEEGRMDFRGAITANDDGTYFVRGELSLQGTFFCPPKDFESTDELLGPGTFTGRAPFIAQGWAVEEQEVPESVLLDPNLMPLVPLTGVQEPASRPMLWLKFTFPEMNAYPPIQVEGLDTSQCWPGRNEPVGRQWALGVSAMLEGDGGEDFNQFFYHPFYPDAPYPPQRIFGINNTEVIRQALFCLAPRGGQC